MLESLRTTVNYFRMVTQRAHHDEDTCIGCRSCYEVCPTLCWVPTERKVMLAHPERCVACGACALQCPTGAARLA